MTAEPEGLIPVLAGVTYDQVGAMFPGARPCRRPHQHPGPRYPSSLVLCHDPAHHGLAGVLGKPAPRHAGKPAIGEHVPAAPYTGGAAGLATGAYDPPEPEPEPEPAMAWAAELADAQRLVDHAGRKLEAARADMREAGDRIATWRRELAEAQQAAQAELAELAAAINVLNEVREREPGKTEPEAPEAPEAPEPDLPDADQISEHIAETRAYWTGLTLSPGARVVCDVLDDLLAYAGGE